MEFKDIKSNIKNSGAYKSLSEIKRDGLRIVKNNKTKEHWLVEKNFLIPIIKSPKDSDMIALSSKGYSLKLIYCGKKKEKLEDTKVIEYIKWGEKEKYHQRPSTKNRPLWYFVGEHDIADFIFPVGIRKVFKVFQNKGLLADKRLYEIYSDSPVMGPVLNSTLFFLMVELLARNYGGGGGPIDATVKEVKEMYILSPKLFDKASLLHEPYKEMGERSIKSIFEECGIDPKSDIPISEQEPKPLPDRAELDKIICDALELTEEERKDVYRAVCQLVWDRISKAKNV